MERLRKLSGSRGPLIAVQVAGVAAVVAGVAFIYWPAALIVGGMGAYLIGEAE